MQNFIQEQKLTSQEKTKVCKNVVSCVRSLHSNGIVHRDLTLSKILICPNTLKTKIIDFGLSRSKVLHSEIDSPEGDPNFRPPPFEIFNDLYCADYWCLALVILSVLKNQKVSMKMGCTLMSKSEANQDITKVLVLLQNCILEKSQDFLLSLEDFFK